jgi:hypothetical protein
MTTKNTKMLGCRITNDIYDSFALIAKSRGLSPGEYLKEVVVRGVNKKFEGLSPQNGIAKSPLEAEGTGLSPQTLETARWWTREEPLIDKPIWVVKGVKYAEGQRLLVKTGNQVTTVLCPGYDGDGNLLPV